MRLVCAIVLVVVLVACGSEAESPVFPAPQPSPSTQPSVEAVPERVTLTPASEPTMPVPPGVIPLPTSPPPTPTPEAPNADIAAQRPAKVSRVVDGDTIDVEFEDGTTDTVRLLGIDTPETQLPNAPNEYGLITDTTCLRHWGELATEFASIMRGQTVFLTLDPVAGDRGRFERLLAYVEFAGQDFGATLIELGFARVYHEGEASREPGYAELESIAREDGKGLWGECQLEPGEPSPALSEIESPEAASALCDPAYPDVCIPLPPPDLDCGDIPHTNFTVLPPDPHRFDGDEDGVGCET